MYIYTNSMVKRLGDELVKGMDKLIKEMKDILHERGVHWMAMEGALREFKRRHPHFNKNVTISYFTDAIGVNESKAFHEFRKRTKNANNI